MSAFKGPDGQEDLPYLLTPGPVTTSRGVKIAMLADYGALDEELMLVVRFIRAELKRIAGCDDAHECILLQGPSAYAMEAAIGSFCPARRKKTLVICNGADGESAARILERLGRPFVRLAYRETSMPRASDVAKTLDEDRSISHVWMSHCETSTGMLNPLHDVAEVVKARGRLMMLDATSTFGGVAINMIDDKIDVLISTADACLEAVPGIAFVMAQRNLIEASTGESHSPSLDLFSQWKNQRDGNQLCFMPPTHVLAALREALRELEAEGGVESRSLRYRRNAAALRERLSALGFSLFLPDVETSSIVQTVLAPRMATFNYQRFYDTLRDHGFACSPGQLTQRQSFRIASIGKIDEATILQAVTAIESTMRQLNVDNFTPGGE